MTSVESTIRELARSRIIANKAGLISQEEIQCWADDQIRRLAEPPPFLFAISTGEESELNFCDRLDLVQERPGDQDSASIAAEILAQLETGKLDMDGLEAVALKCEALMDQESDCWAKFSWISDEIYLAREGVKDKSTSHDDVRETLTEMLR